MKYIFQLGFICILSCLAELMHYLIPLPIPASIYGLVILFLLLCLKIVKVEQVEDIASFFMVIMPVFFISPSVSLITSLPFIQGKILPLLLMAFLSTIATFGVTGLVSQVLVRKLRRHRELRGAGEEEAEDE